MGGQTELCRHAHDLRIQHREHAGQAKIDGAGLGVWRRAIGSRCTGKDLASGGQLGMNFQPDDSFPFHFVALAIEKSV